MLQKFFIWSQILVLLHCIVALLLSRFIRLMLCWLVNDPVVFINALQQIANWMFYAIIKQCPISQIYGVINQQRRCYYIFCIWHWKYFTVMLKLVQRKSFQYQFPNMVYIFHFGLIFMTLVVTHQYKCSQVFALIGHVILIIMYIHIDIPRNVFCMTTTETWLLS